MKRVVLVQYSANFSGSTISARLVAKALIASGWGVHVVFSFDGPGSEIFRRLGAETSTIRHNNWLRTGGIRYFRNYWHECRASGEFTSYLKQLKPDLVYVNSLVSLAAARGASALGIPVIWHVRELFSGQGGEISIPPWPGKIRVRREIERCATHVVCLSKSVVANVFGEGAVGNGKISVVPNAVAKECFENRMTKEEARRRLGWTDGTKMFVGVPGTLRRVKGQDILVRAIPRVCREFPECRFVMTGDRTPFALEVRTLAERLGVIANCQFPGPVPSISEFYRGCDLICIPSRSESFGRTAIEAFAFERPVVATSVGGLREIIEHERTGLLIAPGDADALAEALIRLLRDGPLAKRLAAAARRECEAKYREEHHGQLIAAIAARTVGTQFRAG